MLEYVKANPKEATEYDACLLDEHMPRVNGCEALRHLRDEAAQYVALICYLTSHPCRAAFR